jgi:serine/threonine-protein kinase
MSFPRFGSYEILKQVGWCAGGGISTFQARDVDFDRVVFLKRADNPIAAAHVLAEAEAMAAVRHPHVLPVLDFGEYDGVGFLAAPWVDGDLARRLRAGPIDQRGAAGLVAAVARGVQAAHEAGLIHGDLKPSHILLDERDHPYVTGFDMARRTARAEREMAALVGTPAYMPPERIRGKPAGPPLDVWSLGVTLYECLTGRRPFGADTAMQILLQVLEQTPAPPRSLDEDLDARLEAICLRCLEKDPSRRYATAATLADDLKRWLGGEPPRRPRRLFRC